jgi:hypothetical protein
MVIRQIKKATACRSKRASRGHLYVDRLKILGVNRISMVFSMELRSAAMHSCLVVASQEALGFTVFQVVTQASPAAEPSFWQNDLGFLE